MVARGGGGQGSCVLIIFLIVKNSVQMHSTLKVFFTECKWRGDSVASEKFGRESKRSSFGYCKCQIWSVDRIGTFYP